MESSKEAVKIVQLPPSPPPTLRLDLSRLSSIVRALRELLEIHAQLEGQLEGGIFDLGTLLLVVVTMQANGK